MNCKKNCNFLTSLAHTTSLYMQFWWFLSHFSRFWFFLVIRPDYRGSAKCQCLSFFRQNHKKLPRKCRILGTKMQHFLEYFGFIIEPYILPSGTPHMTLVHHSTPKHIIVIKKWNNYRNRPENGRYREISAERSRQPRNLKIKMHGCQK